MLTFLRRRATLRGPLGGSRHWTVLWVVLISARLIRRFTTGKGEVVFRHELKPGDSLVIAGDDRTPRIIGGR